MRTFVSVDLPSDMAEEVLSVQEELGRTGADLKPVSPENVHVTLKFLGEVEEERLDEVERALEVACSGVPPFEASYEGLGVFPSRDYISVVWIGAEGDGFHTLAENIEDETSKLGFEREEREFVPHATVARMKSGRRKKEVLDVVDSFSGRRFGEQRVETVSLKKSELGSEGPKYTDLAEVEL